MPSDAPRTVIEQGGSKIEFPFRLNVINAGPNKQKLKIEQLSFYQSPFLYFAGERNSVTTRSRTLSNLKQLLFSIIACLVDEAL